MGDPSAPSPRAMAFDRAPELLAVTAVRGSREKVDRAEFHPVQVRGEERGV